MKTIRLSFILLAFIVITPLWAQEKTASPPKVEQRSSTPKIESFDIKKVYRSSPVIYSILLLMSTSALAVWLYTQATFRSNEIMPKTFVDRLKVYLDEKRFDDARALCQSHPNLFASIISAGLTTRIHGPQVMIDAMKSEGKRMSAPYWQRLSILNDIAIISPMLGLLGTVIGMFYAFYDVNRSLESINAVFDGLGISVGTTVVGLVVAIVAMILATTLKYRLINSFSLVENEALSMSVRIETK